MQKNENEDMLENLVQLARLALQGEAKQVSAFVRRLGRALMKQHPDVGENLLQMAAAGSPMRSGGNVGMRLVPVDQDSRWDLLRIEAAPHVSDPVLSHAVSTQVEQIINERTNFETLMRAGMEPSRTVLFTGPPGVGKTLTAHWLAKRLGKPLFVLDLASVMSSFLGKTGNNIRSVLEYAKNNEGVLLLDEFDSVAKRRNDEAEVGELKRLVTVILQEIDRWPADRLLVAATNHGELLDPAVWRRFDAVVEFPLPDRIALQLLIKKEFAGEVDESWANVLSVIFENQSFSDATRSIQQIRRKALLSNEVVSDVLLQFVNEKTNGLPKSALKALSVELELANVPQRQIAAITGLSRDTIRRARREEIAHG